MNDVDSIGPAFAYQSTSWQIEYATCPKLLNSADATGAAEPQLVPDAATSLPAVSADGLTYRMAHTIRRDLARIGLASDIDSLDLVALAPSYEAR